MTRLGKLLVRARRSPQSPSFGEFESLMTQANWKFRRQRGSHRLWSSPGGFLLPVQQRQAKAKAYQVRQFLAQYDKEQGDG